MAMRRCSANGQRALDILKKVPRFPALSVLDMSTPVLNGHQFLAAKAHDTILRNIPVVVVSGCEPSGNLLPNIKPTFANQSLLIG
jgi:CheY-like chemotaxis protein